MVELTDLGKAELETYLREAKAKRREILDAGKDTADETELPKEDDVLMDILHFEENGEYCNTWGVTDNYNADYPLYLKRDVHYKDAEFDDDGYPVSEDFLDPCEYDWDDNWIDNDY